MKVEWESLWFRNLNQSDITSASDSRQSLKTFCILNTFSLFDLIPEKVRIISVYLIFLSYFEVLFYVQRPYISVFSDRSIQQLF